MATYVSTWITISRALSKKWYKYTINKLFWFFNIHLLLIYLFFFFSFTKKQNNKNDQTRVIELNRWMFFSSTIISPQREKTTKEIWRESLLRLMFLSGLSSSIFSSGKLVIFLRFYYFNVSNSFKAFNVLKHSNIQCFD